MISVRHLGNLHRQPLEVKVLSGESESEVIDTSNLYLAGILIPAFENASASPSVSTSASPSPSGQTPIGQIVIQASLDGVNFYTPKVLVGSSLSTLSIPVSDPSAASLVSIIYDQLLAFNFLKLIIQDAWGEAVVQDADRTFLLSFVTG